MTKKKKYNPVVANALVWAALMIATALIVADEISSRQSWILLMLQIAVSLPLTAKYLRLAANG
ncbi:MAG: hypothetical protein IIA70_03905 [Proteobacteria bacterium]|nr:hypothetical protein [Pseudomonadota bacterium]